ncbi:hypothetical protein GGS23DRAFT_591803 [Durotheca rogersii]|uniref:uncharacterized protein n=1 Tax=Durotheca rogersii TaxID=419775 RepID=UPI0022203C2B|nr:uncharacterized protein GGS23DRAFT_591803 [Durotheca rogersii]KAI5867998.1 hypothetical protein GGS23DRAFT_591803 [Durotheca rogersii]
MATPILLCRRCAHRELGRDALQAFRASYRADGVPRRRPALVRTDRRLFATAGPRAGAQATPQPSRPAVAPTARTAPGPFLSYAQQLADKTSPTTLYEVGPQRAFLFSSYAAGFFCMSAAAANVWINVYNVPEGIPTVVPVAFGAVGIFLAAFGTRFAMTPSSMIRAINVLPNKSVKAGPGAVATSAQPVRLEIVTRRSMPFPFLPLRRFEVDPNNVVMKANLYNPKPAPSEYAKMLAKREEEAQRKRDREYEMNHLMTAPFRHGGKAISLAFSKLRRGLTGEGFAPIIINGVHYKLDITSAYALEDGRALDRIVRVEKDPNLHRALGQ